MSKLFTELFEGRVISEESDGKRKLYVEGTFLQQAVKNRNGRIYPPALLEREVTRYQNEYIVTGRAMGELGHPNGPGLNLERVSHVVKECRRDGNNYVGKALILDTPYGKIAESLIQSGVQLGVSSRGMGSLKHDPSLDAKIVQDDFRLAVMIDLVADPSAPEAFVRGVMENVEWRLNELGEWVAETFEDIKRDVRSAPKGKLDEKFVANFERFLEELNEGSRAGRLADQLGVSDQEARQALRRARAKMKARAGANGMIDTRGEREKLVYDMAKQFLGTKSYS